METLTSQRAPPTRRSSATDSGPSNRETRPARQLGRAGARRAFLGFESEREDEADRAIRRPLGNVSQCPLKVDQGLLLAGGELELWLVRPRPECRSSGRGRLLWSGYGAVTIAHPDAAVAGMWIIEWPHRCCGGGASSQQPMVS